MAKSRKRPQKPNATGRNNTSRFVRLDYRMLNSNAYRSLSPNARSLLIEVMMLFNGGNNGSLYLSVEDAAHRIGVADHHAASAAFKELQEMGFIEMTQDAYFWIKAAHTSRARTWRLTGEAGPGRKAPSCAYMVREPLLGTRARTRMERGLRALKRFRRDRSQGKLPVVDSTMEGGNLGEEGTRAVVDSTTLECRNGGKPGFHCMVDSHHHIAATMGSTEASVSDEQPAEVEA